MSTSRLLLCLGVWSLLVTTPSFAKIQSTDFQNLCTPNLCYVCKSVQDNVSVPLQHPAMWTSTTADVFHDCTSIDDSDHQDTIAIILCTTGWGGSIPCAGLVNKKQFTYAYGVDGGGVQNQVYGDLVAVNVPNYPFNTELNINFYVHIRNN